MASKHYHIKLNFDTDREVIDRIESKENKNDYIRGLVLSDIVAEILRSSIKLEDVKEDEKEASIGEFYPSIFKPVDTDDVYYNHEKINWFNEHCPAVGDPNYDCIGCCYFKHHKDDPFSDAGYCDAQSYFEKDMEDIREYFKAGGAKRDYPAEFKGLKKAHLNSHYGTMVRDPFRDDVINNMLKDSNASNALDNDIKKGDPDNG